MPTVIDQTPLYTILPVGQDVVFTVSNNNIVALQTKVKFIAHVYMSSGAGTPVSNPAANIVGVFKTTPNNAGVGMFNFNNIVENYVKADNMAADGSAYKGTQTTSDNHHPIHLIDEFSKNDNAIRFLQIIFSIEYLGATDCAGLQGADVVREACGEGVYSSMYTLFNGYLKETDVLLTESTGINFGYLMTSFALVDSTSQFLTNAPAQQYATINDYGTVGLLTMHNQIEKVVVTIYSPVLGPSGYDIDFAKNSVNGAYNSWSSDTDKQLLYFGFYPANLRESYWFNYYLDTITHYEVYTQYSAAIISKTYTVNILCPDLKGYEPIRLAWLNQWGAWDYFTFNKKSIRSISTKGSTYNQLEGTWNAATYSKDSYKGGKKSFRMNATEKIKINTDFVSEDYNTSFEELTNSPEIYILKGFEADAAYSLLNQYVTPVRLLSKSFTAKTVANDRLIQYTFEIEKTKTLRTQSV